MRDASGCWGRESRGSRLSSSSSSSMAIAWDKDVPQFESSREGLTSTSGTSLGWTPRGTVFSMALDREALDLFEMAGGGSGFRESIVDRVSESTGTRGVVFSSDGTCLPNGRNGTLGTSSATCRSWMDVWLGWCELFDGPVTALPPPEPVASLCWFETCGCSTTCPASGGDDVSWRRYVGVGLGSGAELTGTADKVKVAPNKCCANAGLDSGSRFLFFCGCSLV